MEFTKEQIAHIKKQLEIGLQHPELAGKDLVGASFACISCKVGLNIVAGGLIAVALVAGVAVTPEAAVCVAIAEFFGAEASSIAIILNTAIGSGVVSGVEDVITTLCIKFGAC
ncbi:hypothetical protein JXM83_07160 [Candidatus Woesearchaeota archaeon]|nr:hypothetical protein [Candidatus Woesearchaeota archaeon]